MSAPINALDPFGLVAAQTESTAQQQALADAQIKALTQAASVSKASPSAFEALNQPERPALQLGGLNRQGSHWSDALIAGGRNFANNFTTLRDYRQKREMLHNAALDAQQYEQQRQGLILQQQEQQQRETMQRQKNQQELLSQLNPELGRAYAYLPVDERDAFYQSNANSMLELQNKPKLEYQTKQASKAGENQAVLEDLSRRQKIFSELKGADGQPLNLNTPEGQNAYRQMFGNLPETALGQAEQQYKVQGMGLRNEGQKILNLGGLLDNEGKGLSNEGKRIANSLARINEAVQGVYAEPKAREELQKLVLTNQITNQEVNDLITAGDYLDAFTQKIYRHETPTPAETAALTARLNLLQRHNVDLQKIMGDVGALKYDKKGKIVGVNPKAFEAGGLMGDGNTFMDSSGRKVMRDPTNPNEWIYVDTPSAPSAPAKTTPKAAPKAKPKSGLVLKPVAAGPDTTQQFWGNINNALSTFGNAFGQMRVPFIPLGGQ